MNKAKILENVAEELGVAGSIGTTLQAINLLEGGWQLLKATAGSGVVRVGLKNGVIVRPSEPADEWMDLTADDCEVVLSRLRERRANLEAVGNVYLPAVTPKTIQ